MRFHPMMVIPYVLLFYETLSLIYPLRVGVALKCLLFLLLAVGVLKNEIFRYLGGGLFFAPDLPYWAMLITSVLYSITVIALPFLLVKDVAWLVARVAGLRFPASGAAAAAILIALPLTLWGTWEAVRVPDVVRRDVTIQGLPGNFEGKTVAVLVDLHASALNHRPFIQAIVEVTNALKPDVILMPGDFVDGHVEQRADDLEPLSQLRAPLGVYGSTGNHEYYSGYGQWEKQLRSYGVAMLDNAHVALDVDGQKIVVAGIPDQNGTRFGYAAPDVKQALEGAPSGAPVILMSHRPGTAHDTAAAGIALQVSGHTHGGQMPFIKQVVARANEGFVRGWYTVGDMKLFNSPGTSLWNGFPIRIFDPAEITLLTLHSN